MPQPTYLDPRALAARNPWFAAQQDDPGLDTPVSGPEAFVQETADELDAEAKALPVMPEGLQRLLRDFTNDCLRHAERTMPILVSHEPNRRV